ncbi:MAG: DUF2520 domain-containing protein [Deltaproteobacteria bacterium]|nr:DUF2520 domain-containing protein [Deltaproteobacteria bacterium]
MRLAIVGRGRAASALAPRWVAAGHTIVDQRARGAPPVEGLAAADVVIVAVSDGAIAEVARALAGRPSARDEVWLHLSGSMPSSALRVSEGVPRRVGGLHPLVALTGDASGPLDAVAGIEGEDEAAAIAMRLAREVGLEPVHVDARFKLAYHAAAVTVAGHATALFAQAMALMGTAGIGPDDARRALQPLLMSAARNLAAGPPAMVSTGPIVRGDVGTVRGHLAAIADPHIRATYRLLARTQLALVADGVEATVREALAGLLDRADDASG